MANQRIKIGLRFELGLNGPNESIQSAKTVELVPVAELCLIEGSSEAVQRLVIGFQRHRKRMTILAAVRKREARGIYESTRSAVNHFGDQCKRLKRARTELL